MTMITNSAWTFGENADLNTPKTCYQCGEKAEFTHRVEAGPSTGYILDSCASHIAAAKKIYVPWKEAEKIKEKAMDGQVLKTGEKKDEGKARFELLPYESIEAVARILTAGAKKYADRNWEKGIAYGRVFGAIHRHLAAWWNVYLNGTDGVNHADGNESHLDHAICELMFLSAYEKRGMKEFDDRPKK